MRTAPWVWLSVLVLLFATQNVTAEESLSSVTQIQGVTLSKTYPLGDHTFVLNGAGVRTQFFFKVYVAALYQDHSRAIERTSANALPAVLQLHFLRDVDWDDITEALAEGLKANHTKEALLQFQPAIQKLESLIQTTGEVKSGGVITLILHETETEVKLNQKGLGSVTAPGFSLALLKIWIGDHPAQESLKRALLRKP
jgi:long-chain acyl-CoA synthetase